LTVNRSSAGLPCSSAWTRVYWCKVRLKQTPFFSTLFT